MKTTLKFLFFFALNLLLIFAIIRTLQKDNPDQILLAEYSLKNYAEGLIDFTLLQKTADYDSEQPRYPDMLESLDNEPIEIVGFIAPFNDYNDLTRFYLSAIASGCNFCPYPTKRDKVFVECQDGADPPAGYAGLLRVKGILRIKQQDRILQSAGLLETGYDDHNLFDEEIYVITDATTTLIRGTDVEVDPGELQNLDPKRPALAQ